MSSGGQASVRQSHVTWLPHCEAGSHAYSDGGVSPQQQAMPAPPQSMSLGLSGGQVSDGSSLWSQSGSWGVTTQTSPPVHVLVPHGTGSGRPSLSLVVSSLQATQKPMAHIARPVAAFIIRPFKHLFGPRVCLISRAPFKTPTFEPYYASTGCAGALRRSCHGLSRAAGGPWHGAAGTRAAAIAGRGEERLRYACEKKGDQEQARELLTRSSSANARRLEADCCTLTAVTNWVVPDAANARLGI